LSTSERKERGEILNEDGREIRWMKEIWKRRERIEKKGVRDRIKNFFFLGIVIFMFGCCLFLNKNC
jgi:hypothetical protein